MIAAWSLPMIRAIGFLDSVISGGINYGNDLHFAQSLVVSYGFSLAVALLIGWFLPSRNTRLWILPPAASLLVAAYVVLLAPTEEVIVLFPIIYAFTPAILSLLIGVAGILIILFDRTNDRTSTNPYSLKDPAP